MAVSAWRAGTRITADLLNEMLPRWSAWTPTWTTSSGAATPSFGNATIDCKYAQTGDVVLFELAVTFGSTTNFGGGGIGDNWRFSLPVTAGETQLIAGYGEMQDGAASAERWPLRARITTTTTFEVELSGRNYNDTVNASSGLVDAITPLTWANGDRILLHGHYQSA